MEEKTENIIEVQKNQQVDDERKWCVYCHTNKQNGKKYFGITSRPVEERWKNGDGYRNQMVFWRAIKKYGWDNFLHEIIIDNLTEEEAKKKEIELIALYKTNCNRYRNPAYGYNMTDGGEGTSGRPLTEETRKKISESLIGREMSQESRKKMSESKKGISFTEEHKKKISEGQLGKKYSEETKKKISESKIGKYTGEDNPNYGNHKLAGENNPMYGKHHTEETRQKISKNVKGKFQGEKNFFYDNHEFSGINNGRATPVYCIELDEIFWGAKDVEDKYKIAHQSIPKCCTGKRNYAGKHPITNESLHWLYINDQHQNDDIVVYGAITLGYATIERFNEYLNNLKQKGNDNL